MLQPGVCEARPCTPLHCTLRKNEFLASQILVGEDENVCKWLCACWSSPLLEERQDNFSVVIGCISEECFGQTTFFCSLVLLLHCCRFFMEVTFRSHTDAQLFEVMPS